MNKLSLQAFVAVYFRSNGSVFRSSHINCELRGLTRACVISSSTVCEQPDRMY